MGSHTKSPPPGLTDARRILDAFRRIVQSLRLFDRNAEKSVGLSGAAVFVLQKLGGGVPISVNELADRTHTHQSSVSVVVQRLVDQKFVRRQTSRSDARRLELSITLKGRKILDAVPEAAQDRLIDALHRLPDKARRQLAKNLELLVAETGHDLSPPALFFENPTQKKNARH
jgi:DNA-binding MarR family transcriptional regulator